MVTDITPHTGRLKSLLWQSISIVELTWNQTWQPWLLTLLAATTRVYGRSERAGGSGPWELHPLREWISGLIVCKTAPSLISLDAFVPLPLWSRLRHPMKKIKIWIIDLNVECVSECNHCSILFMCVLDKNSWRGTPPKNKIFITCSVFDTESNELYRTCMQCSRTKKQGGDLGGHYWVMWPQHTSITPARAERCSKA